MSLLIDTRVTMFANTSDLSLRELLVAGTLFLIINAGIYKSGQSVIVSANDLSLIFAESIINY